MVSKPRKKHPNEIKLRLTDEEHSAVVARAYNQGTDMSHVLRAAIRGFVEFEAATSADRISRRSKRTKS